MPNCMVLWCENKGSIPGVNYFHLTKSRHDVWMRALKRDPTVERLSKHNVVCSKHFNPEDQHVKESRIFLKPNAIPKLCLERQDKISQRFPSNNMDFGLKFLNVDRSSIGSFGTQPSPCSKHSLHSRDSIVAGKRPNLSAYAPFSSTPPTTTTTTTRTITTSRDKHDLHKTYQNTKRLEVTVDISSGDEIPRPKRKKEQEDDEQKNTNQKTREGLKAIDPLISIWSHSLVYKIQEFDETTRKNVMQQIDKLIFNTKRHTMKQMSEEASVSQISEVYPSSSKRMVDDDLGSSSPNEMAGKDRLGETSELDSYAEIIKTENEEIDIKEEFVYITPSVKSEFYKEENEIVYEEMDSDKECS